MFKNLYKYDDVKRSEHNAVRNAAGWYYFTHQILEVTGKDAAVFLDYMFAKPIANVKLHSARYTTMLNEQGGIIDDVVIFRLEEYRFWISTLYLNKMIPWFDTHMDGFDVNYQNITKSWDMYAVQGPKSKDLLNSILADNIDGQKFFTIYDNEVSGVSVKVSRAGFSGEKLGYEIYVAPDKRKLIEGKLKDAGSVFGAKHVEEFQIMVWTLPTEKGLYLMSDLHGLTPFETGLDKGVVWERDFVGKDALLALKDKPPEKTILGYIVHVDDAHIEARDKGGVGHPVMLNGEEVGRVAKYTYGYTCDKSIGYVIVDVAKAKIGDKVTLNSYPATLTERIFV
jgi:aminomethyltransferase